LIQRELIAGFTTFEPVCKSPRVLDVDDAIFLRRHGRAARRLASLVETVICGNAFLAEWFSRWHKRVAVIPTAVDTRRFRPAPDAREAGLIGWSGTSSNFPYLLGIEAAIARVLQARSHSHLCVVADRPPPFRQLDPARVSFIRWREASEVKAIQRLAVGLMPLDNSDWCRGKCSLKALTYLACGVPVVVSPVGMNVEILACGRVGLPAGNEDEWVESIVSLLDAESEARRMGELGRAVVEAYYSSAVVAAELARVLNRTLGVWPQPLGTTAARETNP
jgi:glycosyltransferase involved in cell wall biosynthesis